MTNMQELFNNLVIVTEEDGIFDISCPKHLWGVSGCHKPSVKIEAMHYFAQYYADGEYNDLIGVSDEKKA